MKDYVYIPRRALRFDKNLGTEDSLNQTSDSGSPDIQEVGLTYPGQVGAVAPTCWTLYTFQYSTCGLVAVYESIW